MRTRGVKFVVTIDYAAGLMHTAAVYKLSKP